MTKELSDLAWSCLPKELKEEVKKIYQDLNADYDKYAKEEAWNTANAIYSKICILREIFGWNNLTSDAEGEEMLIVSRKRIQQLLESCRKYDERMAYWDLIDLFGSKCLPDEEPKPAEPKYHIRQKVKFKGRDYGLEIAAIEKWDDCDEYQYKLAGWGHSYRESDLEPYTEPRYHRGEKVRYNGYVYEIEGLVGKNRYALKGLNFDLDEDMIDPYEPYTEPKNKYFERIHAESVQESRIASEESHLRNFSKDCDKQFDTILKDSFSKERRLTIAAQMMQGLICAPLVPGVDPNPPAEYLAQMAFRLADALIAEAEKGGSK